MQRHEIHLSNMSDVAIIDRSKKYCSTAG